MSGTALEVVRQRKVGSELSPELYCAACANRITSEHEVISVGGGHEHIQANPAGVVFAFGCFRDAPGCDVVGDPTVADTWFPGFSWQLALCDACLGHLGWWFSTGEQAFFGLILDRLRRRREETYPRKHPHTR